MSRQVESHYVNTGFPTESFIYLFEGLPYNYAELASNAVVHDQENTHILMHTGSNKFEHSIPGNTSYCGNGHPHVEENHAPQTIEEPETLVTDFIPASPEEYIRSHSDADNQSHSDASSSQVFWQNNIDLDSMTYEELLDLGEAVGTQSRGLSKELIASLPTSKYKSGGFFSRKKSQGDQCVICQMEYKSRERQITLPCKHIYHGKCVTKWLSINKACPICYTEVFG